MSKVWPYLTVFVAGLLIVGVIWWMQPEDREGMDLKERLSEYVEVINDQQLVINRQDVVIQLQDEKILFYENQIEIEDSIQVQIDERQDSLLYAFRNADDDEFIRLSTRLIKRLIQSDGKNSGNGLRKGGDILFKSRQDTKSVRR